MMTFQKGPVIFFSFLALAILFVSFASAGTITRTISDTSINPNQEVTVTLSVYVDSGETYYIIDEIIPAGWSIVDLGGADNSQVGHLKWVVISSATNTDYVYTIKAPSTSGTFTFGGEYMFEGDSATNNQAGDQTVVVSTSSSSSSSSSSGGSSTSSSGGGTPANVNTNSIQNTPILPNNNGVIVLGNTNASYPLITGAVISNGNSSLYAVVLVFIIIILAGVVINLLFRKK